MDRKYFAEYFQLERKHWWFKARLAMLETQVSKISENRPLAILNVGAATGATSEMLAKYGTVTSVEFDHDCCVFLNEELGLNAIEASITALPFPGQHFDLACAFDVIEHVDDDVLAVSEMKRVCKKNGFVFCTVPAYQFLWSRHDVINHHKRRYSGKIFMKLFKGSGEIIFCTYFNFFLFFPAALFRTCSRLFMSSSPQEGSGADVSTGSSLPLNWLLYILFLSENFFLKRKLKFPFGLSYLLIWKKNSDAGQQ